MINSIQCNKDPELDRVLVIGGAGVIGTRLVRDLRGAGYKVRVIQNRRKIQAQEGVEVIESSLATLSNISVAMHGVQAVCLFIRAGRESLPEEWIDCCIQGTWNVLEACRKNGIRKLVIGCGDNIFGVPTRPVFSVLTEASDHRSNGSHYSTFKVLEHALIQQCQSIFDIPVTLTIFPFIWHDDLLATGLRAVDHKAKVIYHEVDEIGADIIRPGIHLTDATKAILLSLSSHLAIGEQFLFSGPMPYSSSELALVLARAFPYKIEIVCRNWRSWQIDYTKAAELLGYQPKVNLLEWLASKIQNQANGNGAPEGQP